MVKDREGLGEVTGSNPSGDKKMNKEKILTYKKKEFGVS